MFPNANSLTRFILSFFHKKPLAFTVFFLTPILIVLEVTVMPYALKLMIDGLTTYQGPRSEIFQYLAPVLWLYALSWLILVIIVRLQNWWQAYVLPQFEADIRMSSFAYVIGHSYRYFSQLFSGNVGNKIRDLPTSIESIRMIVSWSILASLASAIGTLIVMATINIWCACVLAIWIVAHLSVIVYFGKYTHQSAEINAEDKSRLSGSIVDVLTNIASVKLFSKASKELEYIADEQAQEVESNKKLIITQNILRLWMDIPVTLLLLGLIYFLIRGWQQNLVSVGDIAFVTQSTAGVMNQMWFLGQALTDLFKEIGVSNQALAILKEPHEIVDDPNAKTLNVSSGQIEFDNVTFHYPQGNRLFKNKNVVIEPGTKVGLVGFSGSGKTSFVYLILRFYEPHQGKILIDGQNILEVSQDSLREAISMIPQDTALFHRNLMENIRYGRPTATDDEVIAASKRAHCHEFISTMPLGYNTMVGERGMKLSGGQRQRIAIARAILKDAPIVILDEATSALDSITEKQIQEGLHELFSGNTTIVIAHRLSTLAEMDRILVFDNGQILEDGNHDQLIKLNGHYARMWRMQAGGFLPETG